MIRGGLAYTSKLTDYIIEKANNSDIVKKQLENEDTDILTNLPFPSDTEIPSDEKNRFRQRVSERSERHRKSAYLRQHKIRSRRCGHAGVHRRSNAGTRKSGYGKDAYAGAETANAA